MSLLKIGHYRVLHKLGAGGKADVYLAEDLDLKRKVAIKLMHRHLTENQTQIRRFRHEAEWASVLNHPNIVTIYEVGEVEKTQYIVTEYVEGETLRTRLAQGPLPPSLALDIALSVASALGAAHEAWIVHRDIKPENIMVRHDGYVKVLDFGAAKLTQGSTSMPLTMPGKIVGTFRYLAPEQISGVAVDPRTDLWALGIVLYEMITGQPPFSSTNFAQLLAEIGEKDPSPLSASAPGTPDELESIVHRALQKDMSLRYQTARDMISDMQEFRDELTYRSRSQKPFRVTQE